MTDSAATVPERVRAALGRAEIIVIGPRASAAPFPAAVAVDGALAGLHEGGTVFRLDDVPLLLRAQLEGPTPVRALLRGLRDRLGRGSAEGQS